VRACAAEGGRRRFALDQLRQRFKKSVELCVCHAIGHCLTSFRIGWLPIAKAFDIALA
jgi:hypothetical protein